MNPAVATMETDLPGILRRGFDLLENAGSEIYLDFASVRRMDAGDLGQLVELVSQAQARRIQVILGSVNVDIYLVLKLVKLASPIEFRT